MRFFQNVLGNEETLIRLGNAILAKEFPHAFIIDGPYGCGKHTLATSLSCALNCLNHGSVLPCGACENCRRILNKNFLDVKYLSKKDGKNSIGVEEVRFLRDDVYLSATESQFKIYIIEEANLLTPQAQNALLKIFEEPPSGVVFFLLCENTSKILSTIKSRAQFIRMQRLSDDIIEKYLLRDSSYASIKATAPDVFHTAVKLSQGSIGKAKALLSDEERGDLAEYRVLAQAILKKIVPSTNKFELYDTIMSLPQNRNEFSRVIQMIVDGLRDLILSKYSDNTSLLFYDKSEDVYSIAMKIGYARLLKFYDAFSKANERNVKNGNMNLILSNLSSTAIRI